MQLKICLAILLVFVEGQSENNDLENANKISANLELIHANPSKRFKRSVDPNYLSEQFSSILVNAKKSNYEAGVQTVIKVLGQFGKFLYEFFDRTNTPDFKILSKFGSELQMIIDHEFPTTSNDKYYPDTDFLKSILPRYKKALKEFMEKFKKFSEDPVAQKPQFLERCAVKPKSYELLKSFYEQLNPKYTNESPLLSIAIEKFDLQFFNDISIQFPVATAQAGILELSCVYADYVLDDKYKNELDDVWDIMKRNSLEVSRKLHDISGSIQYGIPYIKFYLSEWKEVETKVDELMKSNQGESHQKFAERVYGYLTAKYYWKAWFVGSYNETHGWDQHAVVSWKHSLFRIRKYGRSLIVGAPQSKVSGFHAYYNLPSPEDRDRYKRCSKQMKEKARNETEGYSNLCLEIVNELTSCLTYEGFTLIACVKWGNGFKAEWNLLEDDFSFENIGNRINSFEYYLHQFDVGASGEQGLKAYTVIWIR